MPDISKITLPSGTTYDIKDAVAREAISGGVSFIIAWDGASTPQVEDIPAGVVVQYQGTSYTGTLDADDSTPGAFYLVKHEEGGTDFDEYVPVGPTNAKYWEMIGSTHVDLSDVVTDVDLVPSTTAFVTGYNAPTSDSVVGANATFTVTQPTITVTPETGALGATATGTAVTASGNTVAAVTGYAAPTTDTFVKSVTAETGKNLDTTTLTGVTGSTTASKATAATSQTTATGVGTASTTNTEWLKGVSVSDETLVIGAASMNTQTTTQFTFADVTVPVANANATTVATGTTSAAGTGSAVVTDVTVGSSATAITDLGNASTSNVLGSTSVFTVTQPTITLTQSTVVTGITSAVATDGNVAWDSKDAKTVITALGTASTANGLNDATILDVTKGN